jgi:hypothetical protein
MIGLEAWQNFYVIVGSSAGALIGLQFVVMTLVAEMPQGGADIQAGQAFGTPTVVHFGIVLLLSAIVSAPWHGLTIVAALWGSIGLGGIVYSAIVARRMRSQNTYQAITEDWLFYLLLPLVAYALLTLSACAACWHEHSALFGVGAASLLLLFIGIRNAWDTVTYHVFVRKKDPAQTDKPAQS